MVCFRIFLNLPVREFVIQRQHHGGANEQASKIENFACAGALRHLSNVSRHALFPLLSMPQNRKGLTSAAVADFAHATEEFVCGVEIMSGKMHGEVVLPLPTRYASAPWVQHLFLQYLGALPVVALWQSLIARKDVCTEPCTDTCISTGKNTSAASIFKMYVPSQRHEIRSGCSSLAFWLGLNKSGCLHVS